MNLIATMKKKMGHLACRVGFHALKTTWENGIHPIRECQRDGCTHRFVEVWGGFRYMLPAKHDSASNIHP